MPAKLAGRWIIGEPTAMRIQLDTLAIDSYNVLRRSCRSLSIPQRRNRHADLIPIYDDASPNGTSFPSVSSSFLGPDHTFTQVPSAGGVDLLRRQRQMLHMAERQNRMLRYR